MGDGIGAQVENDAALCFSLDAISLLASFLANFLADVSMGDVIYDRMLTSNMSRFLMFSMRKRR